MAMLLFVICAAGYWSSMNTKRHPLPKVCVQQFLYENGTQLCSYLVCRFVLGQGCQEGIFLECSALKLGNVPNILVQTIDRKSCEAGWFSFAFCTTAGILFLAQRSHNRNPYRPIRFRMYFSVSQVDRVPVGGPYSRPGSGGGRLQSLLPVRPSLAPL